MGEPGRAGALAGPGAARQGHGAGEGAHAPGYSRGAFETMTLLAEGYLDDALVGEHFLGYPVVR
jgi:hypothetical protein